MVPFTVYLLQRLFKIWPKKDPGVFTGFNLWVRPGWVVMEIATVIVGMAFLVKVRFPFLLFPISFSMWYLSMDLAPLYPGFNRMSSERRLTVRTRVSIFMGFLMALLGYVAETAFGSQPDFGFWLYLFGTLTFWVAINFDYPSSDLYGSLFLLVNLGLILVGSHLDRTTFHVFGTLGIMEYLVTLSASVVKMFDSALLWLLKALVAAALLSQAIRRDGNIEIVSAVVCVLAFNFNYLQYAASHEFYAIVLLITNLGFVATAGMFDRPLDLWVFTLPDIQLLVGLVFSLTVLVFHAKVAKHFASTPDNVTAHVYLAYRLLCSVSASFIFVFLRQPQFAWVGGMGIPLVTHCFRPSRGSAHQLTLCLVSFAGNLFGVMFAIFLESNLLYLVCCLALLFAVMDMQQRSQQIKLLGCALSIFLVLLSVPLNSKFLITIGALYLIFYGTYLAYNTFKNSLVFPLFLILLGLGVIGSAVQYQRYEGAIQDAYQSLLPDALQVLFSRNVHSFWQESGPWDWAFQVSTSRFTAESFLSYPIKWLFWSGAVTYALTEGPAPYVAYTCVGSVVFLVAMVMWTELRLQLQKHLDKKVKVSIVVVFSEHAQTEKGTCLNAIPFSLNFEQCYRPFQVS